MPGSVSSVCWRTFVGEGFEADGDIGDDDPVQAMEDALRRFPADEVIISTHPAGRSNWLEHGVVNRAQDRFDLPVTHVVVDLEREQRASGPEATHRES